MCPQRESQRAGRADAPEAVSGERFLATLLGNLPGMAYRCRNDRSWTMEFVSDGCLQLTGHRADELVQSRGVAYGALIVPEHRERVWTEVQAANERREPFRIEYVIRRADGQSRWVWEQGCAVRSPDGTVEAIEGFICDISERKRLEEQLRHAQRLESFGRLASGVAHDFNNILQVVLTRADQGIAVSDPGSAAARHLEEVRASALRAVDLIRQLLALGRSREPEPRTFDLNRLVTDHVSMLTRIIGEEVRLDLRLTPEPVLVRGDPAQVEQVLMNLLVNARDAMPEGGTVTVSSRILTRPDAGSERGGDPEPDPPGWARIEVADTGSGMEPRVLERIFEPFFTTKPPDHGTGLGLSVARGIVEEHAGRIEAASDPGRGSRFRVDLPLARPGAAEEASEATQGDATQGDATQAPPPERATTILVAEDESAVRELLRDLLEDHGYRVLTAPDGPAAVELHEKQPEAVDLAIVDVVLPGLTGREVARSLRTRTPALPIILSTGYAAAGLAPPLAAGERGGVLQKPYSPRELLRLVARLLGPRAAE